MLWTCDETGESYSSPIDEPLNKPLQCLCCGKTHALTPGKLDEKDEKLIQQARDTALANPDLYEDFTLAWTGKKHGNGSNPW